MISERRQAILALIEQHRSCVETIEYLVSRIEDMRESVTELTNLQNELYRAVINCVSDDGV